MTTLVIFSPKPGYIPMPRHIGVLGVSSVISMTRRIMHQHGFIFLDHQRKTEGYNVYVPVIDIAARNGEMAQLPKDEQIELMQRFEASYAQEARPYPGGDFTFTMSFNGKKAVTYLALQGDHPLDRMPLFTAIQRYMLGDYP